MFGSTKCHKGSLVQRQMLHVEYVGVERLPLHLTEDQSWAWVANFTCPPEITSLCVDHIGEVSSRGWPLSMPACHGGNRSPLNSNEGARAPCFWWNNTKTSSLKFVKITVLKINSFQNQPILCFLQCLHVLGSHVNAQLQIITLHQLLEDHGRYFG